MIIGATVASGNPLIRQSPDGKDILVPVEIFREYVADLKELEVLREYKKTMEENYIPQLQNEIFSLQVAVSQERAAAQALITSTQKQAAYYEQKSKTPGLGIGAGYGSSGEWVGMVGVVWKVSDIFPW